MVSICPPISSSSNPLSKPLGIVPSAPTTFMFHVFFSSQLRSTYFFCFLWFLLYGPPGQQNPLDSRFSFLFILTRSGILAGIKWSVCISKSQRILLASFSRRDSGLWIYHLAVCLNFNSFHSSYLIAFPTQSCLVWNSFVLVCRVCLLCDEWFHFYHHITCTCYFVASYPLLL